MNRPNRLLAGLLAAQIIIAVLMFAPRLLPSSTSRAPLLGALQVTDIVGLTVQDKAGKSIGLENRSGTWVLPQSDDYPAESNKVRTFLEKLVGVQTDALVTRTASSHKRLQVAADDYVRKIDLKLADGATRSLYLGSPSGAGATHVRLDGQDEVYLARGLNSFEAGVEASAWINTTYLSVQQSQVTSLKITNAQGEFEFVKNAADQWVLKDLAADEQPNIDQPTVLIARLGSVTMLKPLGKAAKPEYGFEQPTAVVTVVVSDTASTKVKTLTIGSKDAEGNYPVISSDSPYYVSVSGFLLEQFVNANRASFLAQPTPTPTPASTVTPPDLTATPELTATAVVTETTPITSTPVLTTTRAP